MFCATDVKPSPGQNGVSERSAGCAHTTPGTGKIERSSAERFAPELLNRNRDIEVGLEQTGEYLIHADRDTVWQALNDPDVLARCIEGCQAMRKLDDERFQAKVKAKIGPVSANFDLDLQLQNVQPPESYRIEGKVKGGPAGFGKGSADVALAVEGAATRLSYAVQASVGGKLAQVGSRLLDGAARKMADDFFAAFAKAVGGEGDATAAPQGEPFATSAAADTESSRQWIIWAVAFGVLGLALVLAL